MQYIEIKIPTQLFFNCFSIDKLQRVQDIPQEELEVPMVADEITMMDTKMVIKSMFREYNGQLELVAVLMIMLLVD